MTKCQVCGPRFHPRPRFSRGINREQCSIENPAWAPGRLQTISFAQSRSHVCVMSNRSDTQGDFLESPWGRWWSPDDEMRVLCRRPQFPPRASRRREILSTVVLHRNRFRSRQTCPPWRVAATQHSPGRAPQGRRPKIHRAPAGQRSNPQSPSSPPQINSPRCTNSTLSRVVMSEKEEIL